MTNMHILETEAAISFVKERFLYHLCKKLDLVRVSSPIAVLDGTGINDELNGVERPVSFPIKALGGQQAQVVHSLAKWKRIRLMDLGVENEKGIVTDMRALRPDEDYTNIHSVYVDQWDWEKCMSESLRTIEYLKSAVNNIYEAMKLTEQEIYEEFPNITPVLPEKIKFIHSQQLLDLYPGFTPKERERAIAIEYGAVFIIGIGNELSKGEPHDGRAPDYDDWSTPNQDGYYGFNGDIIVWHPVLECALELSSMGVRVNKESLIHQLTVKEALEKTQLQFHKMLLSGLLPQSIGGGIGQSRMCMFLLKKRHIGEVQVGIWSQEERSKMANVGVVLL